MTTGHQLFGPFLCRKWFASFGTSSESSARIAIRVTRVFSGTPNYLAVRRGIVGCLVLPAGYRQSVFFEVARAPVIFHSRLHNRLCLFGVAHASVNAGLPERAFDLATLKSSAICAVVCSVRRLTSRRCFSLALGQCGLLTAPADGRFVQASAEISLQTTSKNDPTASACQHPAIRTTRRSRRCRRCRCVRPPARTRVLAWCACRRRWDK